MPDLTNTPWSFHLTQAISWLLMPQKLGNAEAQIIFYDNFTLFLAKSSQWREVVPWESLVYSLLTADLLFLLSLVSKRSLFTATNKTVKNTIRVTKTNCVSREACMAFLLWESFASI